MSVLGRRGGTTSGDGFDSEAEKLVAQKCPETLRAVVAGIQDPDRAREYASAEAARDEPRTELIALCNQRVRDLEGGEGQ